MAGLVIAFNLWGSRRSGSTRDPKKEIEDYQTCINFLKDSEKKYVTVI